MKDIEFDEKTYVKKWLVDGDASSFTTLYDTYKYKVFTLIVRMVKDNAMAEDILQDTFVSAVTAADKFDINRSFLSWLFGIAHKKTIDYFRHQKVVEKYRDEAAEAVGSRIADPLSATEDERVKEILTEAVELLSPVQREVYLMREMGGVAFKDIATITGSSLNTALGRMRLALGRIRKHFEERGYYGV